MPTKPKPNWNEIEGRIDFDAVNAKLTEFTKKGAGSKKTVADLLHKVKDSILKARSEGASYRALTTFLNGTGLPISEPTLRQYLRSNGAPKRKVKPTNNRSKAPAKKPEPSKPAAPPSKPAPASRVVPTPGEFGGPRITNPNEQ